MDVTVIYTPRGPGTLDKEAFSRILDQYVRDGVLYLEPTKPVGFEQRRPTICIPLTAIRKWTVAK